MRFVPVVALLAMTACGGSPSTEQPTAAVLLPPIPLKVTEQGEFGAYPPMTARTSSGELFRIDYKAGIAQYALDGSQRRLFGVAGEGPGEFRALASGAVLPGDSLFAVVDAARARLLLFGVVDGAFRREIAIPPMQVTGQQWRFDGSMALIPISLGVPVFMRWNMTTDSVGLWGEPTSFRKNAMVASMSSGEPSALRDGEGWLALIPGEVTLVRYDSAGAIVGTVPLPRRARRGEPADAKEQLARASEEKRFVVPASMAMGIHRLPDGKVLLMHLDVEGTQTPREIEGVRPGRGWKVELTSMRWWATIYAADLQTACVDQPVPFTTREMSRLLFSGDTVMTLSRLVDDAGNVRSELQRVRFDLGKCVWTPVMAEGK